MVATQCCHSLPLHSHPTAEASLAACSTVHSSQTLEDRTSFVVAGGKSIQRNTATIRDRHKFEQLIMCCMQEQIVTVLVESCHPRTSHTLYAFDISSTCAGHLLLVIRAQGTDGLSCSPDLQIADLLHLSLVLGTVIRLRVEVE